MHSRLRFRLHWAVHWCGKSFPVACDICTFFLIRQQLVLNNYGPTIYAALGFDTEYQLIFQCGWISVGILGNIIGALIMDWTGRRPLLMFGVGGCCVSLILEA